MGNSAHTGDVALVAYHFYPSPEVGAKRMNALAAALRAAGDRVVVFSAFEGLEKVKPDDAKLSGFAIQHVPYAPSPTLGRLVRLKAALKGQLRSRPPADVGTAQGGMARERSRSIVYKWFFNVLQVIDDRKSWSRRVARRLVSTLPRSSIGVIVVSGPPMSSVAAAVFSAHRKKIPVLVDLRDPICWERGTQGGGAGVPVRWGRRLLESYIVRGAAAVTTTSPTLRDNLCKRYPEKATRICCVYNGFDETPLRAAAGTGNRLVIVYAGALYLNRNPFPFLEELDSFLGGGTVDESKVELVFAGECDSYRGVALNSWLAERRVGRVVRILPRLDASKLARLYQTATLLLNFAEGQKLQVPAKTFELLALGREVLVLCEDDSDTGTVVRGIDGVSCVSTADRKAIQLKFEDLYRRHVIDGTLRAPSWDAVAPFSRESQNHRFVDAINEVRLGA